MLHPCSCSYLKMTLELLEEIQEFPERTAPVLDSLVTLVVNGIVSVRRFVGRPWYEAIFAAAAERV